MNKFLATLIFIVHLCVIMFVILIPFINSPYLLFMHSVFVPFLVFHWITNNNTCVLTTLEKYYRDTKTKDDENDCFTCKLIDPVFDFTKNYKQFSIFTYVVTGVMWSVSTYRITSKIKHNEIKNIRDLLVI